MYKIKENNNEIYKEAIILGYDKIAAYIFSQRVDTPEEVRSMTDVKDDFIIDLDKLKSSKNAANLIHNHILKDSLIVIICDYDADKQACA